MWKSNFFCQDPRQYHYLTLCSSNCLVLLAVHRGHHFKFTFAVEWPRSEQGSIYTISDFLQSNNIIMQLPLKMRFSSLPGFILHSRSLSRENWIHGQFSSSDCHGGGRIPYSWTFGPNYRVIFVWHQEKTDELVKMGKVGLKKTWILFFFFIRL